MGGSQQGENDIQQHESVVFPRMCTLIPNRRQKQSLFPTERTNPPPPRYFFLYSTLDNVTENHVVLSFAWSSYPSATNFDGAVCVHFDEKWSEKAALFLPSAAPPAARLVSAP